MSTIEETLERLSKSKFRSSFHLTRAEKKYIEEKGMDVIRQHAFDLIKKKIGDSEPLNDGRQTPMRGHPVFKAMHATACCCRGCLNKWYRVPVGVELCEEQIRKIVELNLAWIRKNI